MRRARVNAAELPYHVTQRGNRRADIFLEAEDRHVYLELLREYSTQHRLRLWTYNLMSNHTHLIVLPETETALSATLRDTHGAYASTFNKKYGLSGHLWQARFYSCLLDDDHLVHAVRYVECNPVRAGLVDRAEDYPWSSALPHTLGIKDRYLDEGLPLLEWIENWSGWLAQADNENAFQSIRVATSTGRVCGSDEFIRRIEAGTGRCLRPRKRGPKFRIASNAKSEDQE
jgi:putative transposase